MSNVFQILVVFMQGALFVVLGWTFQLFRDKFSSMEKRLDRLEGYILDIKNNKERR